MAEPSADDLKLLAEMRLGDAQALLAAGRHSAAYYLAGYAIECALKAILARSFKEGVIPDRSFVQKVYSHNLTDLVLLAGLKTNLDKRLAQSPAFKTNWSFVSEWNETSRYVMVRQPRASAIIEAVGSYPEGILQWLKEHW